jgi:hypothetical protein
MRPGASVRVLVPITFNMVMQFLPCLTFLSLLTPQSRVLQNLTVTHQLNKFHSFYVKRRLSTCSKESTTLDPILGQTNPVHKLASTFYNFLANWSAFPFVTTQYVNLKNWQQKKKTLQWGPTVYCEKKIRNLPNTPPPPPPTKWMSLTQKWLQYLNYNSEHLLVWQLLHHPIKWR